MLYVFVVLPLCSSLFLIDTIGWGIEGLCLGIKGISMISDLGYRPDSYLNLGGSGTSGLGLGECVTPLLSLYEVLQVEGAVGVVIEHQSVPLLPSL